MTIFFNLIRKKIGLSRIGRITFSSTFVNSLKTPTVAFPLNYTLLHDDNFIKEFEDQSLFVISDLNLLKDEVLTDHLKHANYFYRHSGTFERFEELLNQNIELFTSQSLVTIIPFNSPNVVLNKEFARAEITFFLENASKLCVNNLDIKFGPSIRTFNYPELLGLYIYFIRNNENICLIDFNDSFDYLNKFRRIGSLIIQAKEQLDNNLVIMGSGKLVPKNYPLMVYLGYDIIDCSYSSYLASEKLYDTLEYMRPLNKIKYLPCSCVACQKTQGGTLIEDKSIRKIELTCLHNLITAKNSMNKVLQYLHVEDFRSYVEKSTLDDLNSMSLLKILDKEYFSFIKNDTPVTQKNKIVKSLGPLSYFRPDFQYFRENSIKSFIPESSTKLILVFPCSAKKPYSSSKSHKKFNNILKKFADHQEFQEIILTSPLGAIPRQLEDIYPVNSYDISVTGEWDHEELKITSSMLIELLKKYDARIPIICHLEGAYCDIVRIAQKTIRNTFYFSKIEESVTSKESLKSLEYLINTCKNISKSDGVIEQISHKSNTWIKKFFKILNYQFGFDLKTYYSSDLVNIKHGRNKNEIHIIGAKNRYLIGVFRKDVGQVFLTIKGAVELKPFLEDSNFIVFDGDKIKGNTLFRPGIIEFGQKLLPNSHVIILDKEKQNVIGVGEMFVGSNFIKNSKTGRIVKVYEKLK